MIGSSVSIDGEAGQKQYDIQTALTEKGFTLNQDMLDLYSSEKVNGTYGRRMVILYSHLSELCMRIRQLTM